VVGFHAGRDVVDRREASGGDDLDHTGSGRVGRQRRRGRTCSGREHSRSVRAFDGSKITTEVTLNVVEGYKGAVPGERVVLQEVGGRVGIDTQWAFGSAEYQIGETVVAYLERTADNGLRTKHMAIGKVDAEVLGDGRVMLTRVGRGGSRVRELLSTFERGLGVGRRSPGAVRLAGRLQPSAPRLEGISQAQSQFRLMEPGSRWFYDPVAIWGDLNGEQVLGKAAANRIVSSAGAAWSNQAGSSFRADYKGEKNGPGFVCNPGYVTVSFGDPQNQVGNPSSCAAGALAIGGFCASGGLVGGTPFREIRGVAGSSSTTAGRTAGSGTSRT